MERRTVPGETAEDALAEVRRILDATVAADPSFRGSARVTFSRPGYQIADGHDLPRLLGDAARRAGVDTQRVGASFWADSAVLGEAGIPSVLFGPRGAGLHSTEEYVEADDVVVCRDILVDLARRFC
jgi:acetylornithine deacetylase